jgi:MbtH protein
MANPFDNDDGQFFVLVNEEGQHSLWPDHLYVPAGWTKVGPHADKKTCMAWVDEHWTDMRPLSLIRQMEEEASARGS